MPPFFNIIIRLFFIKWAVNASFIKEAQSTIYLMQDKQIIFKKETGICIA